MNIVVRINQLEIGTDITTAPAKTLIEKPAAMLNTSSITICLNQKE